MIEKKVKVVGHDTQANDHPLATAIGPQRNGPLLPHLADEYREWSGGRDWKDDFPDWEPVHQQDLQGGHSRHRECRRRHRRGDRQALHLRLLPVNWDSGDGCIIRLVAIIDQGQKLPHRSGGGLLMLVKRFADAKPYEAPNHRDVRSLRLQGFEAGGPKNAWVGLSHYLPGGGAGPDASPLEKVYVVLVGRADA